MRNSLQLKRAHDTLAIENKSLRAQLAAANKRIEDAEKQEPVAEVVDFIGDSLFTARINRPTNIGEWLYAAPVVAPLNVADVEK